MKNQANQYVSHFILVLTLCCISFSQINAQCCYDPSVITGNPCIDLWDPVCGCDGITYSNSCYAKESGITSFFPGECELLATECHNPDIITGEPCIALWDPVCGCDNVTYSNACFAYESGVTSFTCGECNSTPPDDICYDWVADLIAENNPLCGQPCEADIYNEGEHLFFEYGLVDVGETFIYAKRTGGTFDFSCDLIDFYKSDGTQVESCEMGFGGTHCFYGFLDSSQIENASFTSLWNCDDGVYECVTSTQENDEIPNNCINFCKVIDRTITFNAVKNINHVSIVSHTGNIIYDGKVLSAIDLNQYSIGVYYIIIRKNNLPVCVSAHLI